MKLAETRVRVRVAHLYLEEGLVDDARAALAALIEDLGVGVAGSNWGGV